MCSPQPDNQRSERKALPQKSRDRERKRYDSDARHEVTRQFIKVGDKILDIARSWIGQYVYFVSDKFISVTSH